MRTWTFDTRGFGDFSSRAVLGPMPTRHFMRLALALVGF